MPKKKIVAVNIFLPSDNLILIYNIPSTQTDKCIIYSINWAYIYTNTYNSSNLLESSGSNSVLFPLKTSTGNNDSTTLYPGANALI